MNRSPFWKWHFRLFQKGPTCKRKGCICSMTTGSLHWNMHVLSFLSTWLCLSIIIKRTQFLMFKHYALLLFIYCIEKRKTFSYVSFSESGGQKRQKLQLYLEGTTVYFLYFPPFFNTLAAIENLLFPSPHLISGVLAPTEGTHWSGLV